MRSRRRSFVQTSLARIALGACLILSFLALSVEPAPSQIIPNWNRECKKLLRQYDKKPRHKAFAVSSATSSSMVQACAVAWSMPSKKAAEAAAIRRCHQDGSGCVIRKSE